MDPGVASELDLVILDPEWSGYGRTGAPGAPVLYLNRKSYTRIRRVLCPNRKEVKKGRTKTC